ncbi:MAG: amino-acid N-acetyltransferase [Granulosicoccus sp.]|nr:amino-acid N-acetyltransferase [Granulosicoccus sp.]
MKSKQASQVSPEKATAEISAEQSVAGTNQSNIEWFRDASPYINAHRQKTLVLALPSGWLDSELLPTLTHDLSLLNHLGIRLVLCFGLRHQVNEQLSRSDHPVQIVDGKRVTSAEALQAIVTEAGIARHKLETRLSMGLPNTPMSGSRLSVSSGNFVTAKPFGVHSGIDFLYTGSVREIHAQAIISLLDAGHLVLLPPLGYSLTGEVFNITVNEVASHCAIALRADKLLYFVDSLPVDENKNPVREASARDMEQLCTTSKGASQSGGKDNDLQHILPHALKACRHGVERVHLLKSDDPEALLTELFTRNGSGTLITAGHWEHIRKANIEDVAGIIELIKPLQSNGSLLRRSREQLELDIHHFYVSERDGMVISCAAMYTDHESACAEIACLVTHPAYQGEGRADQLLLHLEKLARQSGHRAARVLSTHTGHWFVERGYVESQPEELPSARRASYNHQRNSKIYLKHL